MVLSVEPLRNFIWDSRQVIIPIVVFAAVVIPTILLMPIGQRWLRESKASTRAGLFIFFMLVLVSIVAIVASLGKFYQYTVLRGVFLAVVCLLPGAMWYLFVGTRKASLLNEYLVNLDRLGLLRQVRNEDAAIRGRRVQGYLQKFEAIYGELAPNVYADVLSGRLGKYSRADTGGVTTLSTATVPVLLATVLISLGLVCHAAAVSGRRCLHRESGRAGTDAVGHAGPARVPRRLFLLAPDAVSPLRPGGSRWQRLCRGVAAHHSGRHRDLDLHGCV
ncbi:hypothetical protein [Bradyrhizobium sp. S3.14.4]